MDIVGNAIVFGGGGGIGRATSLAFAKEGSLGVLVADIDIEAARNVAADAKAVATNPNFRAEAVHVDITNEESVDSAVKQMVRSFGRIDYCTTCAGVAVKNARETSDADVAEFIRLQNVNVTGTFFVVRAVLAIMKTQELRPNYSESPERGTTRGAVVTMGSVLSLGATPYLMQYTTSKHAVLGFTKSAAIDSVKHGIRVNCVCPTWVESGMTRQVRQDIPGSDAMMVPSVPMGRLGAPEEVADAIVFLCSPRSSFVTGCPFIIDGGASISSDR